MEREEIGKVIELYNLGYSYRIIGKAVGKTGKTVWRLTEKLKKQGVLTDRPLPTGHTRQPRTPNHTKHQNNLEMVKALYEADTPLKDICTITGFKYTSILRIVSELCKGGMEKRVQKREPRKYTPPKNKNKEWRIGEPHHCDYKTCIWGNIVTPDIHKCNFCVITGKCRSTICPSSACTVYERVSKSNPRRKGDIEP